MRSIISRYRSFSTQTVWEDDLKKKIATFFHDRALVDARSGQRHLTVARLVSLMYDVKIVGRDQWPTSRIVEEMHQRGYASLNTSKASYGAPSPPSLTLDECFKWIAHFRVLSLNS